MIQRQRFHPGDQAATRNLERAIAMRRERFVGWARSAASALRGVLPHSAGPAVTPGPLLGSEDRR